MTVHLAQWAWQDRSGLPRHVAINTFWFFHMGTPPINVTDYDNVRDMLRDFYFSGSGADTVASFLNTRLGPSSTVRRYVLRLYDMSQPIPRVPVITYDEDVTVTNQSPANLPREVALVVSFQAERVPGLPQARRRNRIFLGPLNHGATGAPSDEEARPASFFITRIQASGADLIASAMASVNWRLIAFSPTYEQGAPEVVDGWVDNAFDTQRRRGRDPTARNPFAPAP